MRPTLLLLLSSLIAVPLDAQEPTPEAQAPAGPVDGRRWIQFGLFGFGVRGGVDFEDDGQAVVGITLDVGYLYSDRLRIRPSGELGFLSGPNTYVANVELVYRLTADTAIAVPYFGAGVALVGQADCATAPDCPDVWAQFVLGFELQLHDQINWLLEYHSEDAFRRHRLFIGLTTRRGS